MLRKKTFWIVLLAVALLGGGGYGAYAYWFAPEEVVEETTLETAAVTIGDLSITADGSGMLVAASEVNLAFDASGTLMELLVEVGDRVQAGDVLGWIDDTDARNSVVNAELSVLQAEKALENTQDVSALAQAVAQAELQVSQTEADLAAAQSDLEEVLNWEADETEVQVAQANLVVAQASYQNTLAKTDLREEELASTRIKLEQAIRDLEEAQVNYANAMDAARDWEKNIEDTRERAAEALQSAQDSLEIAQASYDLALIDSSTIDIQNALVKVLNAEETVEDLQTPPDGEDITAAQLQIQALEVSLAQAQLDLADAREALDEAGTPDALAEAELSLQQAQLKLESAEDTLAGTTLVAPIAGTVVEVNAQVGEKVNGTVVVLADLEEPVIQFWVEESDLNSVAEGHRVNIVFEALPDLTYSGEIVSVDPVLVSVDGTPAAQAWASIDTTDHPVDLLGEMNVEVEIVAGETLNAVLVPVQALREIGDDQYAVFVVQDSGELEMRIVEIGLQDYVHAEVLSGLQRGEIVSTGETPSSSSSSSQSSTETTEPTMPGGGMMMPPMIGG